LPRIGTVAREGALGLLEKLACFDEQEERLNESGAIRQLIALGTQEIALPCLAAGPLGFARDAPCRLFPRWQGLRVSGKQASDAGSITTGREDLRQEGAGRSIPSDSNSRDSLVVGMKRKTRKTARTTGAKRGNRRPMDSRVEDLRRKILFLNPYSGWMPEGAKQRIMNIVDAEGEAIGELEVGSDGFVQVAVGTAGQLIRISYYPGRNHATLTRISLGK